MDLLNSDSMLAIKNYKVIGIDEAQFFPDLKEFLLKIEHNKIKIVIAGLDGDFNRNPFGQILECIPLSNSVTKLNALDMSSKDGSNHCSFFKTYCKF